MKFSRKIKFTLVFLFGLILCGIYFLYPKNTTFNELISAKIAGEDVKSIGIIPSSATDNNIASIKEKDKIDKIFKYLSKLELKEWRKEIPSNNSDNRRYDIIIVTDKHYNFSDLGFSIYNLDDQYITMHIDKKVTTYRIKNGSLSVNDFLNFLKSFSNILV